MGRRLLGLVQHAGLIAVGLVVGLLFVEIAARLFADPPPLQQELRSPPPVQADSVLGWRRPPGARFTLTRGTTTREIAINSEGFRDGERRRDKPPGVARVVVLGDSFTEALESDRERTFPRLLEQGLDAGGRVEVLTFGMRGYGTAQEYLTLRHRALAYQPDAVVLAFFVGNDVYDNGLAYSMRYRARPGPFFTLDGPGGGLARTDVSPEEAARVFTAGQSRLRRTLSPVSAALWPRLQSYGLVMGRLQGLPVVGPAIQSAGLGAPVNLHDADVYNREESPELAQAWRVTEALVVETARLTREQGARLLIAIIPHPVQFPRYLADYQSRINRRLQVPDADRPSRRLSGILSARDIAHVDLLTLFRADLARPSPHDLYLREDGHFTAEGHRLAAHAIHCALLAHRLLSNVAPCPRDDASQR